MSENHMIGDLDQTDSDISQVASCIRTFLVAQRYRICLPMQETGVLSLGWQDPLEEAMATHFSILAWRIPTDRGALQATVHGVAESDTTEQLSTAQPEVTKILYHKLGGLNNRNILSHSSGG